MRCTAVYTDFDCPLAEIHPMTSPNGTPEGATGKTLRARKTTASRKPSAPKAARKKTTASPDSVAAPVAADVRVEKLALSLMDRRAMVAMAAYYRAERRQFASGHELEDWLKAEQEIESLLSTPRGE